jgi:hypothetical protein
MDETRDLDGGGRSAREVIRPARTVASDPGPAALESIRAVQLRPSVGSTLPESRYRAMAVDRAFEDIMIVHIALLFCFLLLGSEQGGFNYAKTGFLSIQKATPL